MTVRPRDVPWGAGFARGGQTRLPLVGVKKDELDTALGYFENNAPRMRYHWFRSRGLFVGSGVSKPGAKPSSGSA